MSLITDLGYELRGLPYVCVVGDEGRNEKRKMITIIIMTCPHLKLVGVPTNATISDHLRRSDRQKGK